MYRVQCEPDQIDIGLPGRAAALTAASPVTAPLIGQHRRIGRIGFELCSFTATRKVPFKAAASIVHVFVPLCGFLTIRSQAEERTVGVADILVAARSETLMCEGNADTSALILHVPRVGVQIAAAEIIGHPCRLSPANFQIERAAGQLGRAIERVMQIPPPHGTADVGDEAAFEQELLAGLVAGLVSSGNAAEAFPVAASVQRVIAYVRSTPPADCSDRELTRIAGITLRPLQRNFRECFGVPLAQFVQETRLDLARERLAGVRESRSIAQLATDLGFSTASIFARAYLRRFGEIPSQTRARAVRG